MLYSLNDTVSSPSAVPEPTTYALLCISLGVVGVHINIPWITGQLEQNQSPLIFTFGHSPAYRTSTSEEYEFQLAAIQPERDQFWDLLVRSNVTAYISSHEHFYARGKVRGVPQIVQGNGGATPRTYDPKAQDPLLTDVFPTKKVPAREMLPGYLVVIVDERTHKVTMVEKCIQGGKIVVVDTFELGWGKNNPVN